MKFRFLRMKKLYIGAKMRDFELIARTRHAFFCNFNTESNKIDLEAHIGTRMIADSSQHCFHSAKKLPAKQIEYGLIHFDGLTNRTFG